MNIPSFVALPDALMFRILEWGDYDSLATCQTICRGVKKKFHNKTLTKQIKIFKEFSTLARTVRCVPRSMQLPKCAYFPPRTYSNVSTILSETKLYSVRGFLEGKPQLSEGTRFPMNEDMHLMGSHGERALYVEEHGSVLELNMKETSMKWLTVESDQKQKEDLRLLKKAFCGDLLQRPNGLYNGNELYTVSRQGNKLQVAFWEISEKSLKRVMPSLELPLIDEEEIPVAIRVNNLVCLLVNESIYIISKTTKLEAVVAPKTDKETEELLSYKQLYASAETIFCVFEDSVDQLLKLGSYSVFEKGAKRRFPSKILKIKPPQDDDEDLYTSLSSNSNLLALQYWTERALQHPATKPAGSIRGNSDYSYMTSKVFLDIFAMNSMDTFYSIDHSISAPWKSSLSDDNVFMRVLDNRKKLQIIDLVARRELSIDFPSSRIEDARLLSREQLRLITTIQEPKSSFLKDFFLQDYRFGALAKSDPNDDSKDKKDDKKN